MATLNRAGTRFAPPPADAEQERHTKEVWHQLGIQQSLDAAIVTELGTKVTDFDGRSLSLHRCEYKIGKMEFIRLVKKGIDDEALRRSYSFASTFRHPAAIIVEGYLSKGSVVMSMVHGSFRKWLKIQDKTQLFNDGNMSPLLRNMVIDLAEVVQAVKDEFMYVVDLSMKDLYIKMLDDGTPKIQVLIVNASKASKAQQNLTWDAVKAIVKECFSEHDLEQSEVTKSFCSSIHMRPAYLRNFPDQWDSSTKGKFLMETCAYKVLSPSINNSGLKWPMKDGLYEPLVLQLIDLGKEYAIYDFRYPNDYVGLCRNTYKHFSKLPRHVKEQLGGSPEGFLRKVEEWTPNIWAILYKATESEK